MTGTVTFDSMALEEQTIELRRFSSLALHHACEHDPKSRDDVSHLAHVTEMLCDKVGELIRWLEANGRSAEASAPEPTLPGYMPSAKDVLASGWRPT